MKTVKNFFYLGQNIEITKKLFRSYFDDNRSWEEVDVAKKSVIVIGIRNLANGRMHYDEDGAQFIGSGYVKALLVVENLKTKPFYIKYPNV